MCLGFLLSGTRTPLSLFFALGLVLLTLIQRLAGAGQADLESFLFGSRYGLLARSAARRRQGRENAARLLVGHLYPHERSVEAAEENTAAALREHLRRDAAKVVQVTAHALAEGLIGPTSLTGDRLTLTDTGRRLAREVWEPWRSV